MMLIRKQSNWLRGCHLIDISRNLLLQSMLLFYLTKWKETVGLVQTTYFHQLYQVVPTSHDQLQFLNLKRLQAPQLIFWNGIGAIGETVLIMGSQKAVAKHTPDFQKHQLNLKLKYDSVKIIYGDQPYSTDSDDNIHAKLNGSGNGLHSMKNSSPIDTNPHSFYDHSEAIERRLLQGEKLNDQYESELLINKRMNKSEIRRLQTAGIRPKPQGLVPVTPIVGVSLRNLSINSGILYRIQGVQTLFQSTAQVGEYFAVSSRKKRSGSNPYITSEENPQKLKNDLYRANRTKSALWMFVPSEFEKFYEIRNRNYPASLLVWKYDVIEREFVLHLETRRKFLKRYRPDGILRSRAIFSFQMISGNYSWELQKGRPKYYLITYNGNRVYAYDSKKKNCALLIVRNTATEPYTSEKADKMNRALDMFYITRLNLTGSYTARIYSFVYDKSIKDISDKSTISELSTFQLSNRAPLTLPQYVIDKLTSTNEFQFKFTDSLKQFQWVVIEANVPSFGEVPVILTGVMGHNTKTNEIRRKFKHVIRIKEKIDVASGFYVNASVIFQSIKGFENPFTAYMEVTEPVDRLYWDRSGNARFIRLSLPGKLIERSWKSRADFTYDSVIERRETAMIVKIKGTLVASYGFRGFVKTSQVPYGNGIVGCGG